MQRFLDSLSFSQPYIIGLLFFVMMLLFMPGCATAGGDSAGRTRDFATTAATTAAGAYVGAREGDGKAKNAAVGAAEVAASVGGRVVGVPQIAHDLFEFFPFFLLKGLLLTDLAGLIAGDQDQTE